MTETKYKDLTFVGRSFKKKGEGKKGVWTLFGAEFADGSMEDKRLKFSAFKGPKKGLCISELSEGTIYTVGYKAEEKTFTNDDDEEITYEARTIFFIDVPKDKKKKESSDLLDSPTTSTIEGEGELTPTDEEKQIMDKLRELDQSKVIHSSFVETLNGRVVGMTEERANKLWDYYKK